MYQIEQEGSDTQIREYQKQLRERFAAVQKARTNTEKAKGLEFIKALLLSPQLRLAEKAHQYCKGDLYSQPFEFYRGMRFRLEGLHPLKHNTKEHATLLLLDAKEAFSNASFSSEDTIEKHLAACYNIITKQNLGHNVTGYTQVLKDKYLTASHFILSKILDREEFDLNCLEEIRSYGQLLNSKGIIKACRSATFYLRNH